MRAATATERCPLKGDLTKKSTFSGGENMEEEDRGNRTQKLRTACCTRLGVPGDGTGCRSTSYASMAPVKQYLMDRNQEIALARSAAPEAISRDAMVLVLGRHGFETAVEGKNGWVCWVGRGWGALFDWPEFWNPKIRAADCLNPPAARSMVPFFSKRTELLLAGHSKVEVIAAIKVRTREERIASS